MNLDTYDEYNYIAEEQAAEFDNYIKGRIAFAKEHTICDDCGGNDLGFFLDVSMTLEEWDYNPTFNCRDCDKRLE